MALTNVSIPVAGSSVVEPNALTATVPWYTFFSLLVTQLNAAIVVVNTIPGVNVFTVATQPTLGAGDAGYLGLVTDTNHLVRWTGAAWQWFGGDASGRFEPFAVAPPTPEFALCDGSATTLLTLGATLTLAAFTTPNLSGTPASLKSGAAYTGTINAAAGASGAAAPGTDTQGSHNHTGATGSHTHTGTSDAPLFVDRISVPFGSDQGSVNGTHTHTFTTNGATASISADGSHSHTVNSHTHGIGTLDVANLVTLPYIRR